MKVSQKQQIIDRVVADVEKKDRITQSDLFELLVKHTGKTCEQVAHFEYSDHILGISTELANKGWSYSKDYSIMHKVA